MIGDVEKMLAVGLIWKATNAAMRRGALLWDQYLKSTPSSGNPPHKLQQKLINSLSNWLTLLLFWQYSIPFLINLSASAPFFSILSQVPISLAVPITNATTFAATAVFGILLGEPTRVGHALLEEKWHAFAIRRERYLMDIFGEKGHEFLLSSITEGKLTYTTSMGFQCMV